MGERREAQPGTRGTPGRPSGPEIEEFRRRLTGAVGRLCPRWLEREREDLVQASVVRILDVARQTGSFEFNATYLWKTAYAVVLDETRRVRWKFERRLEEGMEPGSGGPEANPESRALASEFVHGVEECLRGLALDRRRAVQLRLAGFAHAEAAGLLGTDEKRISNLIYRGFEDLRACLRAKGFGK